jgi:5-hydroxyisourate hydrolase-like protein (transthyretin family)
MRKILFIISITMLLVGCGPARPTDMPETFPCKINVVNAGTPLSGVDVSLFRAEGNGALSITAHTNSNGVADIKTAWGSYITSGVPTGTYKVTLMKYVVLPDDGITEAQKEKFTPEEAEEYEKKRNEEIDKLRVIPKQLSDSKTTPYEIKIVDNSGAELTIDIAKTQ